MKDLILIGGGGHCLSCIDVIEESGLYNIKGILDLPHLQGKKILNYPVIGTDDDLEKFINNETGFCLTIGQIKAGETLRKKIFNKALISGAFFPPIISPHSCVSKHAVIGKGSIVLSGSIINAGVKIGENCIINSGTVIEHGVSIGDNTHISTASVINGDCSIGNQCFIGSGAVIRNCITVTDNTMIGMGSILTKNINRSGVYYGNPAKFVRG